MELSQSKMIMGFRSGVASPYNDTMAMRLAVAILGGTAHSKLFNNVREKLSLCYYCSARFDKTKGIMTIESGVEKENIEKAQKAILKELDDMAKGNITDFEIESTKLSMCNDFVAVGDIDIKVIGAENQLFDTNVPVRQLLEQIMAKLSIPPFLLGLNWSSTERMSAQQADILTSELEYYRRLLTPVICDIGNAFLCSAGIDAQCSVEWENINLQDESALADARLKNAQAMEIEMCLGMDKNNK